MVDREGGWGAMHFLASGCQQRSYATDRDSCCNE